MGTVKSHVIKPCCETDPLHEGNFADQLVMIEGLIREGYIGEARFTIRKLLESQAAHLEKTVPDVFPVREILEKVNQKLLISRSLENVSEIIDLLRKARHLTDIPRLSGSGREGNVDVFKYFLCRLFKVNTK